MALTACCYCVDLRKGSLISGYVLLVYHIAMLAYKIITMMTFYLMVQELDEEYRRYSYYNFLIKFVLAYAIIIALELLTTVVLLVGLHKKNPATLLTSIILTSILLLLDISLLIWTTCEFSSRYMIREWISFGLHVLSACLYVYFLPVFGSYYNKMRKGHDVESIGMKSKSYYA